MNQIVVEFYALKRNVWDEDTLEHKVIRTGKATIEDAYEVAIDNGHNPNKNIRWWSESM